MSTRQINPVLDKPSLDKPAWLDKLAVVLSGICIVHCLLTPVVITLLPIVALDFLVDDILFHQAMLWLVLPTSSIALFLGCRKHRNWLITGTGITGMVLLTLIAFFAHDALGPVLEKLATSVAGLVLATSHILNFRACQEQRCDDKNCSEEHHH